MADEEDDIWRRKYLTLESRLKSVELENEKIVNRIYQVKKFLKRYRRERSFLIKKCEVYGIDYQKALCQYSENILAEINSSSHEENYTKSKRPSGGIQAKKGKGRTQHKQEKERDPNAPKKPANAFFMFCQQQRNLMQGQDQKDSTVGHHELTKHLAKEWNSLGAEGKTVYYKMYEKDKERYEQEMRQYTKDKPPKEITKTPRTKKPKSKKTAAMTTPSEVTKSSSAPSSLIEAVPEPHNSLVGSPTLNILNSMPFSDIPSPDIPSSPNIPSPVLEIGDDDGSYNDFDLRLSDKPSLKFPL